MTDTESSSVEFDIRRRAAQLVKIGYEAADHLDQLQNLGAHFDRVAEIAWGHLAPAQRGTVSEERFGDTMFALLFTLRSLFGVTSVDEQHRAMNMMAVDPTWGPVAQRMHSLIDQQQNVQVPRMEAMIKRLFAEHPSPLPDQAPALECAVQLQQGPPLQGALSVTPEGGLRMLVGPVQHPQDGPGMIEHFFDFRDVVTIAIFRKASIAGSRLIV
jgi:hypothetical protein